MEFTDAQAKEFKKEADKRIAESKAARAIPGMEAMAKPSQYAQDMAAVEESLAKARQIKVNKARAEIAEVVKTPLRSESPEQKSAREAMSAPWNPHNPQ